MNILSHLRLRTKLVLLTGISALGLIVLTAIGMSVLHQRMVADRVDKLHAVTDTALGLARSLENEVIAHRLTRDQAIGRFREAAHVIRFDAGDGYIVGQTEDNLVLVHGANPGSENGMSTAKDATGRPLMDSIAAVLRHADQGVVSYTYIRPGGKLAEPKVSYVARFAPWRLILTIGAYTSDLDAAFAATLRQLALTGGSILLICLLAAWLIDRDVTGSLGRLQAAMGRLSQNELDVAIPGSERRDEIGAMAAAVLIFQQGLQRAQRLAGEQQQERARAEAAKREAMVVMAQAIESEAREAMTEVGRRTATMAQNASSMTSSAQRTGNSADAAAMAATQAQANIQTVASAAEQLSASIREIAAQVGQSSQVVARAVEAGRNTRTTIEALNEQVSRIGSVADIISEIAAKTNLLALNATIEAARAGDAGKGFAVVASEVKQLATQTARSTEQITHHIAEVHAATSASVAAVGRIDTTIGEINAIAGSIAAAVEQQGAATAEIARNVTETASAADEMTQRTQEVSAEAGKTGRQAAEVLADTSVLKGAMQALQAAVVHVLRTATSEVDRRRYRRRPCLVTATVTTGGQSSEATVHDLSERGCQLHATLRCQVGEKIEVVMPSFGNRMSGTVVERTDAVVNVAFTGDGLPSGEVDRISLSTIPELVKLTKKDHLRFVQSVVSAIATRQPIPPGELPNHHTCRLGRWHDSVSDTATLALASIIAIAEPHHGVHDFARQALVALGEGDMAAAQAAAAEMKRNSERVLRCLDDFEREYPSTMTAQPAPALQTAAA